MLRYQLLFKIFFFELAHCSFSTWLTFKGNGIRTLKTFLMDKILRMSIWKAFGSLFVNLLNKRDPQITIVLSLAVLTKMAGVWLFFKDEIGCIVKIVPYTEFLTLSFIGMIIAVGTFSSEFNSEFEFYNVI